MIVDIDVRLACDISQPVDLILQVRAPSFADQNVLSETFDVGKPEQLADIAAEAGLGSRTLLRTSEYFPCSYAAKVEIDRPSLDVSALDKVPPHLLSGDVVRYLMPSRYCPSDEFQSFVAAEFGHLDAGHRVAAMRDWIFERFAYVPGSSNAQTTAIDTFVQRQGVCRDYAHVLITLARASAMPVASQIVRIGVGMDAAEVAFLSSFGPISLIDKSVNVTIAEA
ncbi:transglutaminase family protein [uncultured Roseobacter sp.]|uniref:transglutaminase-like domain-containing protein n=1 Tax=uncultured Roseobacter sp. TaxID=114847 RepID=UPI00262463FA|nr:transglutaminase family protein [uncultured Roseobacter sp.]